MLQAFVTLGLCLLPDKRKSDCTVQGESLLFIAVEEGRIKTMEALIQAKAKIDERNKKVIHFAYAIFFVF